MKVFIEGGHLGMLWVFAEYHDVIKNILETSFIERWEWGKMGHSMFCVSTEILQEFVDISSLMDIEVVMVSDDELISAHDFRMHCENILGGEYEPVH